MTYQLLRVEISGKICEVLIVEAPDDQAALVRAQGFTHDRTVEVWRGSRQIAAVRPTAALGRLATEHGA